MSEGKTIGQLMEEMRAKAGAQNYHGHGYMDLQRFAEDTRHMIIFDVLTNDSPVGWKGERTRLFLSDTGYEKALDIYDSSTNRFDVLYEEGNSYGGLHCGTAMEVLINDKWIPTRIEYGNDWYLVGVQKESLPGLQVRI